MTSFGLYPGKKSFMPAFEHRNWAPLPVDVFSQQQNRWVLSSNRANVSSIGESIAYFIQNVDPVIIRLSFCHYGCNVDCVSLSDLTETVSQGVPADASSLLLLLMLFVRQP